MYLSKTFLYLLLGLHLVVEDPENVKNDFAFDNPAFKTEHGATNIVPSKSTSPLDHKWLTKQNGSIDKRKAVDDSYTGVSDVNYC